ncbi:MAG TPA: hypothetical protein VGQ83_09745 [Polyangia bacterium]|jgi:hypothetical protein
MAARLLLAVTLAAAGCGAAARSAPCPCPCPAAPAVAAAPPSCQAVMAGRWLEEFVGRSGCSDTYEFTVENGALAIRGTDCNDGKAYDFEELRYDCRTLRLRLRVRETGYRVTYDMRPEGDIFVGEATVQSPGGEPGQIYQVRWRRAR